MVERPGKALSRRKLHFIWIADCSGSMAGSKMGSLNHSIAEALPDARRVAEENPFAEVLVRAVKFSDGAQWHVSQPTPIEDFEWEDLQAGGLTDMGKALSLVAKELTKDRMGDRGFPPVLALITDGEPTDDFRKGLHELRATPWGKRAVRVAIAIGDDPNLDILQEFIGHSEIKPLTSKNPQQLANHIRFVSTAVLGAASAPASQTSDGAPASVVQVPVLADDDEGEEVW